MREGASILIIGGYGGFGARLCRRLATAGQIVIVAGRSARRGAAFAQRMPNATSIVLDRHAPDLAARLEASGAALVIDASGPFQGAEPAVARAAIAAGIHYLDLADAGDFIDRVATLDAEAVAAGVAVISGASSVPALSGAVAVALSQGMERVTSVDIAISASNRGGAGASVAQAMLIAAGQPYEARAGGRQIRRFGWTGLRRRTIQLRDRSLGPRLFADVDVPDHGLLPARLPGAPTVRFRAGTDRGMQVLGLRSIAALVRGRLLRSGSQLAWLIRPLQRLTGLGASRWSGMEVRLVGLRDGMAVEAVWTLLVGDGRGPEVPTLPAALLAMHMMRGAVGAGARDAGTMLTLNEFGSVMDDIGARTGIRERVLLPPLYRRLLGSQYQTLPPAVRGMHEIVGTGGAAGELTVTRGRHGLTRLIAAIMRFPPAGTHRVHVLFEADDRGERWTRDFNGNTFVSHLSLAHGRLVERFGPLRFSFDVPADAGGLRMLLRRWSIGRVPLPLFLAPRIMASETEVAGRFTLDVAIAMPMIGTVVRYTGWLIRIA